MKKPISILILLFITIGALVLVRSVVSASITTSGLELSQIKEETSSLKTKNAILRQEIFSYSSLTNISERADKVGFVDGESVFAVSGKQTIARSE